MAAITQYEANRILGASLANVAYSGSTSYLALMTAQGTVTAAGTEVSGGSYARKPVTWAAASAGQIANSQALSFDGMPAVASPTQIVGVEVLDAASGGNRKWFGALGTPRNTAAGDTLAISSGALVASLS